MDTENIGLLILKYAGGIIAAGYGVYATLSEFHIQENGKRVLAKKGYIGIALLIVSCLLALSADAFKDRKELEDKRQRRISDQNISDQLSQQLDTLKKAVKTLETNTTVTETTSLEMKTTAGLLDQNREKTEGISKDLRTELDISKSMSNNLGVATNSINRILDPAPIQSLQLAVDLIIPGNQVALKSYLPRLMAASQSNRSGGVRVNPGSASRGGVPPNPNDKDEEQISDFFMHMPFMIAFSKEPIKERNGVYDLYYAGLDLSYRTKGTIRVVNYSEGKSSNSITLSIDLAPTLESNNGSVKSLADFLGLNIYIQLQTLAPDIDYRVFSFSIATKDKRSLDIEDFKLIGKGRASGHGLGERIFATMIPKNAKWESDN